jgi:multidrug efflux pump subunit AcrB
VLIDRVAAAARDQLPESFSYEWSEVFLLQITAGNTAAMLLGLGVMLVFLVLAALYESWSLPLAVILVVPLCLLAAVAGLVVARLPIDILAQVGLVVLVGLASKNAILIVEFARQLQAEGHDARSAAATASRLRLRPILMTSLAFILGVLPLVLARGAGAELRWSLGITVFAGMIGVTLFGIFLTPVFYEILARLGDRLQRVAPEGER